MRKHPTPGPLERNLLDVDVQTGTLELYNGLLEKSGAIIKRPGLMNNQTVPVAGPIQAIYYWYAKGKFVVVAGGNVWAANSPAGALSKVNTALDVLSAGNVTIGDTGYFLYFASTGGGKMVCWDGTNPATYASAGAPPENVTSLTVLNRRVICNSLGTNQFWYTDPVSLTTPTDELEWTGYLEVGRTAEEVVGVAVNGGELIIFKRDMLQAFFDDGSTPYKPLLGSQQFYGLVNAAAIAPFRNHLFFVTPDQTVRLLANRDVTDISTKQMGRELRKVQNANNVVAFRLDRYVCFKFSDENLFYVYDPVLQSWSQFTSFSSGRDRAFIAECATVMLTIGETNSWLIGGSDGKTYFWEPAAYNDAGQPIHFLVRTPHFDWGTSNRKTSTRLVAKVSTEPLREIVSPDISWPNAVRCIVYYHQITLPEGVSVSISGLPDGFTATQVGQVLTISGSTEDYVGSTNVTVTVTDARGASYDLVRAFIVEDYDIEIGVL